MRASNKDNKSLSESSIEMKLLKMGGWNNFQGNAP